jgi:hypothetical protein
MSCYEFSGFTPVVHESSFIHPPPAVTMMYKTWKETRSG